MRMYGRRIGDPRPSTGIEDSIATGCCRLHLIDRFLFGESGSVVPSDDAMDLDQLPYLE